jgi:dTDP-4-amino-4,6-dideoxygalactose transaminase
MHPLYRERLGWTEHHFPQATRLWSEIISLPIFSDMAFNEMVHVADTVKRLCRLHSADTLLKAA